MVIRFNIAIPIKQNGNVMRHYFDSYNLTNQYLGTVNLIGGINLRVKN